MRLLLLLLLPFMLAFSSEDFDTLLLSNEQKTKILPYLKDYKSKYRQIHKQKKILEKELKEELLSDKKLDSAQLIDKYIVYYKDELKIKSELVAEIHNILDEKQKADALEWAMELILDD